MQTQESVLRIREFLARFVSTDRLADDDNLFEVGAVNSLFAMQLVLFVEQEFGIVVDNEDLDVKNFSSVNALVSFVSRKNAVSPE